MATQERQSKLRWHLPVFVLIAVALSSLVFADEIEVGSSGYALLTGDKFFLLSESNFSSDGVATVRLEAPGRWALQKYSGADILVYRIPHPLEFLKKQKNLHRIRVTGHYVGEGLANALRYLWDNWYKKSRLAWRRIFSPRARRAVIAQAPGLKQTSPDSYSTTFENNPQFKPLAGFELVERFRYPIWQAKPIDPTKEARLAGSSSEFIQPQEGNVRIPLGRKRPGLYLVEAIIGQYRATTVVFVSDTVAITKISSDQLLVWTANKKTGLPSPGAEILLTDGTGTVQRGTTGRDGALVIRQKSPERSYVIGRDAEGGIFVSENFYYDSEIYGSKLYSFTDRPLYQPGDTVHVKLLGRLFRDSRTSIPVQPGSVKLAVLDSNGTPVTTQTFPIGPEAGGNASFRLPGNALSGGYTLRLAYRDIAYTGSFRVAQYAKPHHEVEITLARKAFKTGEPIRGQVRLAYPNGKPVKGATLQLSLRAQKMTMVEAEQRYLGRFPIQLAQDTFPVAPDGTLPFELPAATEPSRYVLYVVSTDAAAYRVTATREILIQADYTPYALTATHALSKASEAVTFTLHPLEVGPSSQGVSVAGLEVVRLEDQATFSDKLPGASSFSIKFPQPGSYMLYVRDERGNLVGSTSHWVMGAALNSAPGSISIVLDKEEYKPGETAHALITFPEKVQEALITLERDQVMSYGLLSKQYDWVKPEKQSDLQWTADIPIQEVYSPNVTLSLLYVMNGNYLFQNKGIKVSIPTIQINFKPNKTNYLPGERVVVNVETTLSGKPIPAHLAIGVVDEMVYVLQPEIAPPITDFFYHIRRDQVRTSSSLNFHTYDMALPAVKAAVPRTAYRAQPLKRARPRRENIDTALWLPDLRTDASGHAQFSFTMPDALSRWRITGRAISSTGSVGHATAYILSSKAYYLKWTGPTRFRQGDQPKIVLVGFNEGTSPQEVTFDVEGPGARAQRRLVLQPGANYLDLSFAARETGVLTARLSAGGRPYDLLQTRVSVEPVGWSGTRSLPVRLTGASTSVKLPPDARNIRLDLSPGGTDSFLRVVDGLLDYPYGCVEQTASRLIPLSLALQHLKRSRVPEMRAIGLSESRLSKIRDRVADSRSRLVRMAGPEASFGWWGDMTHEDPFLTAYAYYADWAALRALDIEVPAQHWEKLLEVYKRTSGSEPLINQAIILWLASEMGLPTRTLTEGVIAAALVPSVSPRSSKRPRFLEASWVMATPHEMTSVDMAWVLLKLVADRNGISAKRLSTVSSPRRGKATRSRYPRPAKDLSALAGRALRNLSASEDPLAQAVWLLARSRSGLTAEDRSRAERVLSALKLEMPTIDRSLALIFIHHALGWKDPAPLSTVVLGNAWRKQESELGRPLWHFQGNARRPIRLTLHASPPKNLDAYLLFDSHAPEPSRLPVGIERRLYRLVRPTQELVEDPVEIAPGVLSIPTEPFIRFDAEPVGAPWNVNASDLYLDEIRISHQPRAAAELYRYGVLEVPLPPGAEVETRTWGIRFGGKGSSSEEVGKAVHYPGDRSYAIPIASLDPSHRPLVFRHLVRFSQAGTFVLPRARYFRMYQPHEKAFEGGNRPPFRPVVVR